MPNTVPTKLIHSQIMFLIQIWKSNMLEKYEIVKDTVCDHSYGKAWVMVFEAYMSQINKNASTKAIFQDIQEILYKVSIEEFEKFKEKNHNSLSKENQHNVENFEKYLRKCSDGEKSNFLQRYSSEAAIDYVKFLMESNEKSPALLAREE